MERTVRLVLGIVGLILCLFLVNGIVSAKISKLKETSVVSDNKDVVSIRDRERQLDCLARNIYHEAGHESFEGKVAVAQVTINRSNNPNFPNDICRVVYQKNVVMEKVICQFSWYCDSTIKARTLNNNAYSESYEVAKKVLLEGFRLDIMKEAMYYHADYVKPGWKLPKIGQIGNHIFYKERRNDSI